MYNCILNITARVKTRRGSPVDCQTSTAEAPPIYKIHPFNKIDVTLEPVKQFGCPSNFKISKKNCNIGYSITESTRFNHQGVALPCKYFDKRLVTKLVNYKGVYRAAPGFARVC